MSHICTIDHHCEWTSKWWKQMWEMEREQVKRLLAEKGDLEERLDIYKEVNTLMGHALEPQ